MDAQGEGPAARRRKLFLCAHGCGLTRQERIDLAEYLLRRDVSSWKSLTEAEVGRLLDAFEGHALIAFLLSEKAANMASRSASGISNASTTA